MGGKTENGEGNNFQHRSYLLHKDSYKETEINEKEKSTYQDWFNNGTVDVWRHRRMLEHLVPLLETNAGANWLTIADGRWGTAAQFIEKNGGRALATDIDDRLLKKAVESGMIRDYKNENAEKLSFEDNSFDFAYCKESFHHFPRPFIALYEMLRVSKTGIVLTEPQDWIPNPIPRRVLQLAKHLLKKLLNSHIPHTDSGNYETVGNYIYTISEREFQKIALGLNLPTIAFKYIHDVYFPGVEEEKIKDNGPLLKKINRKLFQNKIMRFFGLEKTNQITAIIFKESIPDALRAKLYAVGFTVIDLPRNPYAS